jgi:RNA polymerase sigma-70 factor (ECF subfamily)
MKLSRHHFEKLALEQMDAVDRVARALTRNPAEADDLVQETYLRAFRAADRFELQSFGIRPWLFRILHNVYNTRAVRENRQPRAIESEFLNAVEDPADASSAAVPDVLTSAHETDLGRAMAQLPPDLHSVLTHWAVDELTYKEIAEVTNVPIGTVMSRLHRARRKLAQHLQGFTELPPGATE